MVKAGLSESAFLLCVAVGLSVLSIKHTVNAVVVRLCAGEYLGADARCSCFRNNRVEAGRWRGLAVNDGCGWCPLGGF